MTTEATQSPVEVGPAPENGQGQSQSHRRRRRRRKNKSSHQNAAAQVQVQTTQPQEQMVQAAPQQPQQQKQQVKRKKKFFQKNTAPAAQPGNSIAPQAQGKRKIKQKGPREFVGPMDHSYRVVNGNVADGPPSTIPVNSNRMTHWDEPFIPPAQISENTPVRIYCFIEDLFFLAKIQETSRKLGVKVEFVKGADKEAVARILALSEEDKPALVVFDLGNTNAKPLTLIPKFKTKYKKSVSIIGFLSHLQGELKMKAAEAGCDTVMPRSAFSQSLPNLLRRYGVVEEEEEEYVQPV